MARSPRHPPPVRRPPLPFHIGDEVMHGYVIRSGDRWIAIGDDEMNGAFYEELRGMEHGPDPISAAIGPALLRMLSVPPCPALPSSSEAGHAELKN